jgi:hypothetical protein
MTTKKKNVKKTKKLPSDAVSVLFRMSEDNCNSIADLTHRVMKLEKTIKQLTGDAQDLNRDQHEEAEEKIEALEKTVEDNAEISLEYDLKLTERVDVLEKGGKSCVVNENGGECALHSKIPRCMATTKYDGVCLNPAVVSERSDGDRLVPFDNFYCEKHRTVVTPLGVIEDETPPVGGVSWREKLKKDLTKTECYRRYEQTAEGRCFNEDCTCGWYNLDRRREAR